MDLHQRLQVAARSAASFEYQHMILPKGEPADLVPKHDQSHLLNNWSAASDAEQTRLAEQVKTLFPVDTQQQNNSETEPSAMMGVTNIFHASLKASATLPARFEAPDPAADMIDVAKLSAPERARLEADGVEVLARGKGAVLILAGGSGTRLGVSFPKGMLVCPDTVAPRSLFQWHCERILGLQRDFAAATSSSSSELTDVTPIPLVVMLSPQNEKQTKEFFAQNANFGLRDDQVLFFTQSCMPCFNPNGKIVLAAPGEVSMAPGGNAGIYPAIFQSGVLRKLQERHVELIQVVTVDNLLVSVADPILFGSGVVKIQQRASPSSLKKNANADANAADPTVLTVTRYVDVVAKATPKLHDGEAVGVFARRAYPQDINPESSALRWGVLEYSEVGPEVAAKKRPGSEDGERLFNAANIAVHLFSTSFVEEAAQRMLSDFTYYHIAKKPVATSIPLEQREALYGADYLQGAAWAPSTATSTPAIKLEAFIFDLFQFAQGFKLLNVVRSEEFSAIKNADDANMVVSSFRVPPPAPAQAAAASGQEDGGGMASPSPSGSGGGMGSRSFSEFGVVKKDSPQSAVRDLHMLHAKWLTEHVAGAGGAVDGNLSQLAALITKHGLRVEFAPAVVARAPSVALALASSPGGNFGVSADVLQKVSEYCEGGRECLLVLFVGGDKVLSAIDMSKEKPMSAL